MAGVRIRCRSEPFLKTPIRQIGCAAIEGQWCFTHSFWRRNLKASHVIADSHALYIGVFLSFCLPFCLNQNLLQHKRSIGRPLSPSNKSDNTDALSRFQGHYVHKHIPLLNVNVMNKTDKRGIHQLWITRSHDIKLKQTPLGNSALCWWKSFQCDEVLTMVLPHDSLWHASMSLPWDNLQNPGTQGPSYTLWLNGVSTPE